MSRHVVINGRELSMNDAGFIDPNSEWSVTVGEDGSFEVNRLDLKAENAKLRELIRHMHCCSNNEYTEYGIDFIASHCKDCEYNNDFGWCNFERRMAELGIEVE